ncbi:14382_t:CDS:2, partial [Dentiscutata erythropus]
FVPHRKRNFHLRSCNFCVCGNLQRNTIPASLVAQQLFKLLSSKIPGYKFLFQGFIGEGEYGKVQRADLESDRVIVALK